MNHPTFFFQTLFVISLTLTAPTFAALTTNDGGEGGESSITGAAMPDNDLERHVTLPNLDDRKPDEKENDEDIVTLKFAQDESLIVPSWLIKATPTIDGILNGPVEFAEAEDSEVRLTMMTREQFTHILPFMKISLQNETTPRLMRKETKIKALELAEASGNDIIVERFSRLIGNCNFLALPARVYLGIVDAYATQIITQETEGEGLSDRALESCPHTLRADLQQALDKARFFKEFEVEYQQRRGSRIALFRGMLAHRARREPYRTSHHDEDDLPLHPGFPDGPEITATFILSEILGDSPQCLNPVPNLVSCRISDLDITREHLEENLNVADTWKIFLDNNCFGSDPAIAKVFPGLRNLQLLSMRYCGIRGPLNVANLTQLPDLDISQNIITQLLGIDNLSSLQELKASSNELVGELDLSACTQLTSLNLSGNNLDVLKIPTSCTRLDVRNNRCALQLDVTGCTNLRHIDCSRDAQFASDGGLQTIIGLDTCKVLEKLDTTGNPLMRLTLKDTPNLSELCVDGTTYDALCASEISAPLDKVVIHNYEQETLDLSPLPPSVTRCVIQAGTYKVIQGLNHLENLSTLNIDSANNLEALDVSGLHALNEFRLNAPRCKDLIGTEDLVVLQKVEVCQGQLRNVLDLSESTQLKLLCVGINELCGIIGIDTMPELEILSIGANPLSGSLALGSKDSLKRLCLKIDSECPIDGLYNCVNLYSLKLMNCRLAGTESSSTLELSHFPKLEFLSLDNNGFGAISGFDQCSRLLELSLANIPVTTLPGLEMCKQLKLLALVNTDISDSLDVSQLTGISWLLLVENRAITEVQEIENAQSLRSLRIVSCPITVHLDLGTFPLLKELEIRTTADGRAQLVNLSDCTTLKTLHYNPSQHTDNATVTKEQIKKLESFSVEKASHETLELLREVDSPHIAITASDFNQAPFQLPEVCNLEILQVVTSRFSHLEGLSKQKNLTTLVLVNNTTTHPLEINVDDLPEVTSIVCDASVILKGETLGEFVVLEQLVHDEDYVDLFDGHTAESLKSLYSLVEHIKHTQLIHQVSRRFGRLNPNKQFKLIQRIDTLPQDTPTWEDLSQNEVS